MGINFQLTKEQKQHFETACWLINDGPFRTGRTHVLACAFIQKALYNRDRAIPVFDHFNPHSSRATQIIFSEIDKIISQDPNLYFQFNQQRKEITYKGKR